MGDFDFRVIGPLEVCHDAHDQPLGRPRLRQLLLALLADPGGIISGERLLEVVWRDRPPATGLAALHNLVGSLRRWFDGVSPGSGREVVRTHPGGYVLAVRPEQVDAHRFEVLHAQGVAALAEGRVEDAAGRLDDALALWRGVPFADAERNPDVRALVTRLEELHRAAEEARADAELRLRPDQAVVRLQGLVAAEPLREFRWELYILALYRAGRQQGALAAHAEVRRHLREELGADPGPRLQALQEAVLRQDPSLDESPAAAGAATRTPGLRPLPAPVSSLIGRNDEVGAVTALVEQGRLVTLTGPGGVGKTRLAIAAARGLTSAFSGGVAFVRLGPLRDASGVLPAIAAGIGVRGARGYDVEVIAEKLGDQRVLLVLDTLEHLPDARLVLAELLSRCEHLTLLTTSRSPLHLTGERRFPVPSLPVPEPGVTDPGELAAVPSVALFVQRVEDHDATFSLDSAAAAVAAWCRHLGGVPLAIELAAARVAQNRAALHVAVPRLDDLGTGPVDAPPRQRSVRATLDWSVSRLGDDARRLFARLSVFRGMPDLDAIAAVGGTDAAGFDELVRASLAILQDQGGVRRVTMLDMVCEYARELLSEPEAERARSRHAAHYLGVVEAAHADGNPPWRLDQLDVDANDLQVALAHLRETGAYEQAARCAAGMYRWWRERGDAAEGLRETLTVLDAAGDRLPEELRAELLTCAGFLAAAHGNDGHAAHRFEAALERWEHLGSDAGVARALYGLGATRSRAHAYDSAIPLLERALVAARRGGAPTIEERSLAGLASIAEAQGRWSEARRRYAQVEEIAAERSHLHDVAHCQARQAAIAAIEGEHEAAAELARSALATATRSGSTPALAFAEALAGVVALERGDGPTATLHYRDALERCLDAGLQHWALDCLSGMASAAVLSEQPARAAALYAAVDRSCADQDIRGEPGAERESHERCRRRLWTPSLQHHVATATAEGQELDFDEAVDLARRSA